MIRCNQLLVKKLIEINNKMHHLSFISPSQKLAFALVFLCALCLEITSAIKESNTASLRGSAFEARKLASGYWQMRSGAGYCLDVPGSNTGNGVDLIVWECHNGDNQLWTIDNKGYIRSKLNYNKCIDPQGPSTANGSPVQLWDCEKDYSYQMWNMNSDRIASKHSPGQCIHLSEKKKGGRVIMWGCNSGTNQQWSQTKTITGGGNHNLNHCEVLRLELIAGCVAFLPNVFGYAGCMAAAATAWHICFESMDRRVMTMVDPISTPWYEDATLEMMLKNVDAPEGDAYDFTHVSESQMTNDFEDGKKFGNDLVARLLN